MRREDRSVTLGVVCLAVVGVGILAFGLLAATVLTSDDAPLLRADGLACVGLGLFGLLITLIPFRRLERWAWFALWFYPVFWLVHLVGRLPPGNDHVHQVVFIVLSLAGLLLPIGRFFPQAGRQNPDLDCEVRRGGLERHRGRDVGRRATGARGEGGQLQLRPRGRPRWRTACPDP